MKADDVRKLSDEELDEHLAQLHKTLFGLRSQAETEKLEKPSEVTKAKRDIARILTVQGERRRAAAQEAG